MEELLAARQLTDRARLLLLGIDLSDQTTAATPGATRLVKRVQKQLEATQTALAQAITLVATHSSGGDIFHDVATTTSATTIPDIPDENLSHTLMRLRQSR